MAIDYTVFDKLPSAFGKGRTHPMVIKEARSERAAVDRKGTEKVKQRSGGRCEVTVAGQRCKRTARETHHHLKGNGQRGRGESAKAKHKTHACDKCHRLIEDGLLIHVKGNHYRGRPK
jgi:hypothetical protein